MVETRQCYLKKQTHIDTSDLLGIEEFDMVETRQCYLKKINTH
jgi:hypothetical protein